MPFNPKGVRIADTEHLGTQRMSCPLTLSTFSVSEICLRHAASYPNSWMRLATRFVA